MSQNQRVLRLLKKRRGKGVTIKDFPKGFRLAARKYDLSFKHDIKAVIDPKTKLARYIYVREL
jgi:hypothetical protein